MNAGIPEAVQRPHGRPSATTIIASVEALFEQHPGQIAGADPGGRARADEPQDGFLHELQRLCHAQRRAVHPRRDDHRLPLAQRRRAEASTASSPTFRCFGKALANGFSVSALAGKREFMRLGGLEHTDRPRVFLLSTTHGAEDPCAGRGHRHHADLPARAGDRASLRARARKLAHRHRGRRSRATASRTISRSMGAPCCLLYATLDAQRPAVAGVPHAVPAGDHPARRADAVAGGQLRA